jgi:hypothetical protein
VKHVTQLNLCCMPATLTCSNQFILPSFILQWSTEFFFSNSCNNKQIFTLQKKPIRTMAGTKPRISCRCLFKILETLALLCEYIVSLMDFTANNQGHFQTSSAIHSVNTRKKNKLYTPTANLSRFKKSVYYTMHACIDIRYVHMYVPDTYACIRM